MDDEEEYDENEEGVVEEGKGSWRMKNKKRLMRIHQPKGKGFVIPDQSDASRAGLTCAHTKRPLFVCFI